MLNTLAHLREQLLNISATAWCKLSPKLGEVDQVALDNLTEQANTLIAPVSWYSFLSVKRFMMRRRLFALLKRLGDKPSVEQIKVLYPALLLEQSLRPIRKQLQSICDKLRLPIPENGICTEMLPVIEKVLAQLNRPLSKPHTPNS